MGGHAAAGADGHDELLALALSRPNEAVARARVILAAGPGPLEACVAHQVIGLVLREFGDVDAAIAELRIARRLAVRAGLASRESDVLGTLGVALVYAGHTTAGLNALNQAVRQAAAGPRRGRPLLLRAACRRRLGDFAEALDDLNSAIGALRAAGDQLWEARALGHRALCLLAMGSVQRAAADHRRAEELFDRCGQELESADAIANRGLVALRTGQLPDALACFDAAGDRYTALGVYEPDLSAQRCAALIAAGLAADAVREADTAISRLARVRGQQTLRAELLLVAANCALAAGDPGTAMDRAAEAGRLFGRQGRSWWQAHARLARVRAAAAAGLMTPALLRDARRCVRELAALGSPDLPLARLAAGRVAALLAANLAAAIAADEHRADEHRADEHRAGGTGGTGTRPRAARRLLAEADEHFAAAAAGRHHGPALSRAAAWLAQACRVEAAGDPRRLMYACRHGLAVLDDFRSVFGSSELRAQSTAHGAELAALGQRHAARLGRPRLMLEWSERWRAVALAVPAVRPPADELLQADLAALREVTSRLAQAADTGMATAPLEQERQRLERAVRARALYATAGRTPARTPPARTLPARTLPARTLPARTPPDGAPASVGERAFSVRGLLDALGDGQLVELVEVGGELSALVCGGGRVRRITVGSADEATRAVRFARLALRRVAHGPPVAASESVVHDWLRAMGERLDRALLGEAGDLLTDENLVVVPPGRLHAVPWGMLPRLRSRAVSVAPSAASWLRAADAEPRRPDAGGATRPAVFVRGPGMASRGAEVPRLAADYAAVAGSARPSAPVVLGDGTATVAAVLRAIDGAELAHIAAHGTFRADSPLFSSLTLDDGPLTVYDLERLRCGPRRLVLSSCDSGVAAPAGADEVLGLASSLIPLGTTGIVASVVPVNDSAVVPLMIELHRELRGGASLARALRDARVGLAADPVAAATGWSFICLGS
jgi:tetratricopeptide (TPR) repeat protein